MAFEKRDNSGVLFKNEKKKEGSNQPDYTGNSRVDGVDKDISAWVKVSKNGKKFISIAYKEPWVPSSSGQSIADEASDVDALPF